ncbi:MAG: bifunctional DNA-formamidopyrimidine glycosylase/DNA-(apurinic or apyrimidinic site) lyase [Actinomycetales bacterium]|nr:bifunctional DNA-formamidopyrimidine glycosylase/DNA-(apurinic or apyrimidinic site) lyase [Actinomycetales bacterium]
MPELPEVETVRRGLHHLLTGYTFRSALELHPRVIKPASLAPLSTVIGARINTINRRGKFLWFELDRDYALVAHLGMSGQFLIARKDRPAPGHVRAQFRLSRGLNKRDLAFSDQRTFGWLSIEQLTDGIPQSARHIALDPFDPHFNRTAVITRFKTRKAAIKSVILNQEIMSGVGNIYADESLWRAKIHPETPACDLSAKKIASLIDAATEVMAEAIKAGGTSFDSLYINVNGESGFFETSLAAYGQEHQPCPRCGREIRRIAFGGRSSHFCPKCQKR